MKQILCCSYIDIEVEKFKIFVLTISILVSKDPLIVIESKTSESANIFAADVLPDPGFP
jgi:hypothetical protein